jgi:hypothetical protein
MKKGVLTVLVIMGLAASAMASNATDSIRKPISNFKKNWFISADGNIDWWKGSDNNPAGKYAAVQWNKPSFGASLNFGKWLNNNVGVRLSYDVNGGKSYIDGLHSKNRKLNFLYDGTFTYDENGNFVSYNGSDPDQNGYYNTAFTYHHLHADVMISPIDLIQGYYNPKRIYTPVLYAGMGTAIVSDGILWTPDIVHNIKNKGTDAMNKGVNFEFSAAAGLINNFRLSNHLDLHLDLKWSGQRWNIDTWFYEPGNQQGGWVYPDGTIGTGNVANDAGEMPTYYGRYRLDQNFSVGLGLTFFLNRDFELPNNYLDEINKPIETVFIHDTIVDTEIVNIHDTIFKQTEEIISYPFSIFFNLDSYQLMSRRDLVNLREIANVAKANGYKIRLRGSADSATATPPYNQTLSENRCRKIMMELMEMGIPESQIILVPVGGVKELDPTEFDRRVLVELVKEVKK